MKKIFLILLFFQFSNAQTNILQLVGTTILPYNTNYLVAFRIATNTPAAAGALRYSSGLMQYYNGSTWKNLSTTSGGGSVGNADSLGGFEAAKWLKKSDSTSLFYTKFASKLFITDSAQAQSGYGWIPTYSNHAFSGKVDSTVIATKTFLANQYTPIDSNTAHRNYMQVNRDSINSHNTRINAAIQRSLDSDAVKQATITGAATTITSNNLTASRAVVSDVSGKVAVSATTAAEIGYVSGVTSAIQTQLNSKADKGLWERTSRGTLTLAIGGTADTHWELSARNTVIPKIY